MKVREFARHIGVSHTAVLKGCAIGRLTRASVRRDEAGRVVDIEPEVGEREWRTRASRLPPLRRSTRDGAPAELGVGSAPGLVLGGLEDLEQPGAAYVAIRFPLDRFLAGAARGLSEAGKEPTPDALRAVVESVEALDWWLFTVTALRAATDERSPIAAEEVGGMWEAQGREAALGEGRDGDGNE